MSKSGAKALLAAKRMDVAAKLKSERPVKVQKKLYTKPSTFKAAYQAKNGK